MNELFPPKGVSRDVASNEQPLLADSLPPHQEPADHPTPPRNSTFRPRHGSHEVPRPDAPDAKPEGCSGEPCDFSSNLYAAPFGRYEVAAPTEGAANEILVGRERERARVTDWLLTMARSGALLVTGHRGVGKSQFVDFCLSEFEQDVYKRYLRSNIGRVWFWDLVLAAALVLGLLFSPVLLSSLLEIVCHPLVVFGDHPVRLLGLVVLTPLILLLCHPLLYAWRTLDAAADVLAETAMPPGKRREPLLCDFLYRWRTLLVRVLCVAVWACAWAIGPFAQAAVGMACFVCFAAWLHAVVHAVSIRRGDWPLDSAPSDAGYVRGRPKTSPLTRCLLPMTAIAGGICLLCGPIGFAGQSSAELVSDYVCCVPVLYFAGLCMRLADAVTLRRFLQSDKANISGFPAQLLRLKRSVAGELRYRWIVLLLALLSVPCGLSSERGPQRMTLILTAGLLVAGLCLRLRTSPAKDANGNRPAHAFLLVPRGRYVLALKSCACFTFTLQLLTPVLRLAVNQQIAAPPHGYLEQDSSNLLYLFVKAWLPEYSLLRFQLFPRTLVSPVASGVWGTGGIEATWVLLAGALAAQIIWLEYSWIVRRHERDRLEAAHAPEGSVELKPEATPAPSCEGSGNSGAQTGDSRDASDAEAPRYERMRHARELARATVFWLIFETWLPVLRVRVNLGFDGPSHARVVAAMLAGLREAYHQTFISWRSRLGIGFRTLQLFIAILLTMVIADCLVVPTIGRLPDAVRLNDAIVDLRDYRMGYETRALSYLLPYESANDAQSPRIRIRVYHLALVMLFYLMGRRLFDKAGFYRTIDRHLSELSVGLSSTVKVSSSGRPPVQIGGVQVIAQGDARETSSAPQDPRAVEYAFHQILQRLVSQSLQLPIRGHVLSLPSPEVVFIFDELDKIGARANGNAPSEATMEVTRIQQLHELFADMKNLLSVAPARFIFVGGRNLHDEWLADQTHLRPLLSSIFDLEVYLPTLLSDPGVSGADEPDPARGTRAFLEAQLRRVALLHEQWQRNKRLTQRLLPPPEVTDLFFVQAPRAKAKSEPGVAQVEQTRHTCELDNWPMRRVGWETTWLPDWSEDLRLRWVHYMAFRSRGVPRALNELLESFVRPTARAVGVPEDRFVYFDCQHVVCFSDTDRYRIQFVAALYRQLCGGPNEHVLSRSMAADQLVRRRDDTIQTAFYLADMVFKFHGRAFSWSNLERIDELAYVHAPAGIRQLLQRVVQAFCETHIMATPNGIYDFRFRSEIEAEISYLSRHSPKEMAALNFTLDESQALRQHYLQRLKDVEQGSRAGYELEAAVGELYDFDERYDHARAHYDSAIRALDAQLRANFLSETDKTGTLTQVLDNAAATAAGNINRRHVQWGVSRLRLMLQIGMTYERARNYEQALAAYRDARTLARAMWIAMLDSRGRGVANGSESGRHRLHTLKQVPLLYQPLLATAWLAEKAMSACGTATTLLEEALWDLRSRLPSARETNEPSATNLTPFMHPEFFLTMAELHQGTAQLYFFRGNNCQIGIAKRKGPLISAEYHYRVALHEMRRCVRFLVLDGAERLNPSGGSEPVGDQALSEGLVRRLVPTLFGLAESWVAQVRLSHLGPEMCGLPDGTFAQCHGDFMQWLGGNGSARELEAWLGVWARARIPVPLSRTHSEVERGAFSSASSAPRVGQRLLAPAPNVPLVTGYVALARVGIELLARADHRLEAAREAVRCAAGLENLICCLRSKAWLRRERGDLSTGLELGQVASLARAALDCLTRADELILETTGRGSSFGANDTDRVFAHARTLSLSLGLHVVAHQDCRNNARLSNDMLQLVNRWRSYASQPVIDVLSREKLRERLCDDLTACAYPMLNRLNALRVLVLDAALLGPPSSDASKRHMQELVRQNAAYAAPFHFTPFDYGLAAGLWSLRLKDSPRGGHEEMAAHALRALRRSVSMMSSGASHYERLADLYYLDGDFSDRCIQTRQSQQLAASELTVELIAVLEGGKPMEVEARSATALEALARRKDRSVPRG